MVDNRHAKEGAEPLLARLGEVMVIGMRLRVFEVDWFGVAGDQTYQTLANLQANVANGFFLETLRGHQHMTVDLRVQQIDRANLRVHCGAHTSHDDIEGRLQIPRSIHLLNYMTQSFQHHL